MTVKKFEYKHTNYHYNIEKSIIFVFEPFLFFKRKKTKNHTHYNFNSKQTSELYDNLSTNFKKKIKFFRNKSIPVINNFIKFYKIKKSKLKKFSFKYLWYNLFTLHDFFFSSYSNINYSWLSFKTTRTNYFSTFFHTGNLSKPAYPTDLNLVRKLAMILVKYRIKTFPKVIKKSEDKTFFLPFNLHPYVSQSKTPFSYVVTNCSAGKLKLKKKAKRSKSIPDSLLEYYSVYFSYFFSLQSVDFLFFKLQGFFRIFRVWKKFISKRIKHSFFKIKKNYRAWKKYKKTLKANKKHEAGFTALANTLKSILTKNQLMLNNPLATSNKNVLNQYFKKPNQFIINQKNKLSIASSRIMFHSTKFPKSIYWIDSTSYPFNGCKRVRHYK